MKIYIYGKSGHSFGMENVRRCAVIYKILEEFDPVLATSDYRAATFAKYELGASKGFGADLLTNLPNIMDKNDILIYQSDEANNDMKKYMRDYSSLLYEIGDEIPEVLVADTFYDAKEADKKDAKVMFIGDDDYKNELFKICEDAKMQDIDLLMGHYFFLGNEKKLALHFNSLKEEDEYVDTIKNTKYLLTSSIQALQESLASGNCPVFFKRDDKETNLDEVKAYGVPIISQSNIENMMSDFDKAISNYPKTSKPQKFDFVDFKKEIKEKLDMYSNALPDYVRDGSYMEHIRT